MPSPPNPEQWVDDFGDSLYRYALSRTQSPEIAEDLVQETLLAALQAEKTFAQKSSVKTWLIGILKHKILDHFRKHYKEATVTFDDSLSTELRQHYFDENDHWQQDLPEWLNPDKSLENHQFWTTFKTCLDALPPHQANIFLLCEMEGLSAKELCKVFDMKTTNNVWVTLSRIRMRLRACLESRWFEKSNNSGE